MKGRAVWLLMSWIVWNACYPSYPDQVTGALEAAGEHTVELEKVIVHYSQQPSDSLQLRAVYFLIAHMSTHYSYQGEARAQVIGSLVDNLAQLPDSLLWQLPYKRSVIDRMADSLLRYYGSPYQEPLLDITSLTAAYLIEHIDASFAAWQQPLGRQYSFSQFCRYVLPYRSGTEPPERWHAPMQLRYDWLSASNEVSEPSLGRLVDSVHAHVRVKEGFAHLPDLRISEMSRVRLGDCQDNVNYTVCALRAQGIPATYDLMLGRNGGHSWAVSFTTKDSLIYLEKYHFARLNRKLPKVYRATYHRQSDALLLQDDAPEPTAFPALLRDVNLADVTDQYTPTVDLSLSISSLYGTRYAYLCIFGGKQSWMPVQGALVDGNKVTFNKVGIGARRYTEVVPDTAYEAQVTEANIGKGMVYIVGTYQDQQISAVGYPLLMHGDGSQRYLVPDTVRTQTIKLLRKDPRWRPHKLRWPHAMVGGKFQGAHQPDFKDAVDLHTIAEAPDDHPQTVRLSSVPFRYLRYCAPDSVANVAEVAFYDTNGERLAGKPIGAEGIPGASIAQAYDQNSLTYYSHSLQEPAWVGLDLGREKAVGSISYQVRNDGNAVQPGDTYELFCHDEQTWRSLGVQTADTAFLTYHEVPTGALFWLQNHTRGREEQIFTYEQGKQVWWNSY